MLLKRTYFRNFFKFLYTERKVTKVVKFKKKRIFLSETTVYCLQHLTAEILILRKTTVDLANF